MRLLQLEQSGGFSLTKNLIDNIPPYAILSHTWGSDDEEVTFKDVTGNSGTTKLGYKKIQFCGEQARRDGLHYFWVDTCCIDKSDNVELSEAIISMFRWYRNSSRCYVFLTDVSSAGIPWDSAFGKSRWFTRGWTLQELIAPSSVEFFSLEGTLLGSKTSLEDKVHKTTRIPNEALRGAALSTFSFNQRLSWAESRQTQRAEDKAYCLLGMLNISMPLLYGEGVENSMRRLQAEVDAHDESGSRERTAIARWLSPLPYYHIHNTIERAPNTCKWIFQTQSWNDWRLGNGPGTLWVHGERKTAISSAVVDKITGSQRSEQGVAYFYCNASDNNQQAASAVIAGLVQQLLMTLSHPIPSLLKEKYRLAQRAGFDSERPRLKDCRQMLESLHQYYQENIFIIDGLDECTLEDRASILDTLLPLLQLDKPRTKLVLTSRNQPDLYTRLSSYTQIVVNAASNSTDIHTFVSREIDKVILQSGLLNGSVSTELKAEIVGRLSEDANGMFLWAKLQIPVLCQSTSENRVRAVMASYPRQLETQYERMISAITNQENDVNSLATEILRWITFACRPLKLDELWTVILALGDHSTFEQEDLSWNYAVQICQNFVQFDATLNHLRLIHTSARQYLEKKFGKKPGHGNLATQCARYLTDCGFDQRIDDILQQYVEPEPEEIPKMENPVSEEAQKLWDIVQEMAHRSSKLKDLILGAYPFLGYAGDHWLEHADEGLDFFSLHNFPWIIDEKSSVFASWRKLNGFEDGLVLHAMGDLGLVRLQHQLARDEEVNIAQIAAHLGLKNLLLAVLQLSPGSIQKRRALVAAATEGRLKIVKALSDRQTLAPPGAFTALMYASSTGHISVVTSLLSDAQRYESEDGFRDVAAIARIGACISPNANMINAVWNICGSHGDALFAYELVDAVISSGEYHHNGLNRGLTHKWEPDDINALVRQVFALQGWSPLMVAALRGNEDVVPLLLTDPSMQDLKATECALVIAVSLGHVSFVRSLTMQPPSKILRATAFGLAIHTGNEAILDILINGISPLRLTLLHVRGGIKSTMGEVASTGNEQLISKLASKGFRCCIQDDEGRTPLHIAVENNHEAVVRYLIRNMSLEEIDIEDINGDRAIEIAISAGFDNLRMLLASEYSSS